MTSSSPSTRDPPELGDALEVDQGVGSQAGRPAWPAAARCRRSTAPGPRDQLEGASSSVVGRPSAKAGSTAIRPCPSPAPALAKNSSMHLLGLLVDRPRPMVATFPVTCSCRRRQRCRRRRRLRDRQHGVDRRCARSRPGGPRPRRAPCRSPSTTSLTRDVEVGAELERAEPVHQHRRVALQVCLLVELVDDADPVDERVAPRSAPARRSAGPTRRPPRGGRTPRPWISCRRR